MPVAHTRTPTPRPLAELLGIPHVEGGRSLAGMDCLGVTLEALRRAGVPEDQVPDPWRQLERLYREQPHAIDLASLFPPAWRRVGISSAAPTRPGVVLTASPRRGLPIDHVGAVVEGRVWTSRAGAGCYSADWSRVWETVAQLWILPEEPRR